MSKDYSVTERAGNWGNPGRPPHLSGGRIFFSEGRLSVLTLISVSVPPPCYRSSTDVKDRGHTAKSAGGRLQLNSHTPYVCGFA